MLKKHKFLFCLLALCLCFAMTVPAFAADIESETEQIKHNIEQNVEAYLVSEDGEEIALEIESIDVVKLPMPNFYSLAGDDGYSVYAATIKTKTDDKTLDCCDILASASMTMTWIDGTRDQNTITNLTGLTTVAKGSFHSGWIYWGSGYDDTSLAPYKLNVGKSFNKDINYTSDKALWGTVRADYYVGITNAQGNVYFMRVKVQPGIFS